MKQKLLLVSDVDGLGRKGEIVTARPGYIRNYLLPKQLAVIATKNMLRKQEKLQQEREEQAKVDRKVSEELQQNLVGVSLEILVKVDPEGHMYGSVGSHDIVQLFAEKGFSIDKKHIALTKPIKVTGKHVLQLKLPEGILASVELHILPEGGVREQKMETPPATPEES